MCITRNEHNNIYALPKCMWEEQGIILVLLPLRNLAGKKDGLYTRMAHKFYFGLLWFSTGKRGC